MLKQRMITALILAVLVAADIYWLPTVGFALTSLAFVVGLAGWEWITLTGSKPDLRRRRRLLALLPTVILCALLWFLALPLLPVLLVGVAVWAMLVWLLLTYQPGVPRFVKHPRILKSISLPVLVTAWYALVYLHAAHYAYVFYIIALVAVADIGAYFSGKRFGRTKLAPKLSPGKTWEGVYGALLLTFICALFGAWLGGYAGRDGLLFILFSMLAVIMSVLGDLFESLIKREAGAKDSGRLLPGHGGVFDRIDGLLAALPVFTLGLLWIRMGAV